MSLTRFVLKYRPVAYTLMIAVLAFGLMSVFLLSRREDPDLQGRFVQIIASYPGASARQTEELLADPLERTLLELDDIKTVTSTSRPGIVVLQAEASDAVRDLKKFLDELRNRVTDVRPNLPKGVLNVTLNDRFSDTAAMILAVTQPGATDRQREDLAKKLQNRLRRLSDVAEVKLLGEQEERVDVLLSSQRLAQLSLSPTQVSNAISSRNTLPIAGGSVVLGATRLNINPTGNLTDFHEIETLVVATPNDTPVYLRDVAQVKREYADPPSYLLRINGQPAVGVTVTMRKGRNISSLGAQVERELATLKSELPAGAKITRINDLPRSVARRMGEFTENLVTGVALIFVVMYLFMGLRSAIIVGVMLPVTILGTFAAMYVFGRDIQQISIAALIIALGLVVDNSIVVVDNIERKLSAGMPPEQAAIEGTDELRVPLITSNLTTVASFAPLLLLSGGVGEFIRDLGVVTSLATLISLIFNFTMTPMIALRFLKGAHDDTPKGVRRVVLYGVDRLRDALSGLAERGLHRPGVTLLAALGVFGFAVTLIPKLGIAFFPSAERNQFTMDVWLPEGRDILTTAKAVKRIETLLSRYPQIENYAAHIGQGGPRFYYNVSPEPPAANYAQVVVNTGQIEGTHDLVVQLQKEVNAEIPDARVTVRTLEQGPPVGAPVAVRVIGDNIEDLRRTGEAIKSILIKTPGAVGVYHNYGETPLALTTEVDTDRAALAGLSSSDVAQATQLGFSGMTASYLREGDKEIPIQVRLNSDERGSAESLGDLYLPVPGGKPVLLRQVAKVRLAPQEGRIVRRNHVRTLTVSAFSDGSRLASRILKDAQKQIETLKIPPGITLAYGGEQEEVGRTFTEMVLILGLSVVANLVIVVWEFNSFAKAFTILAAVPLSMAGAIFGLYAAHQPFGFMAFLGITSLGGVVTNHAIVLFEYALKEQEAGLPLDRALLEAGRRRLRPILLTVLLSIGGLIPQAVNGGSLWPPLAWALIYGLLMSLLLTLVVVPSLYKWIAGKREKAMSLVGEIQGATT